MHERVEHDAQGRIYHIRRSWDGRVWCYWDLGFEAHAYTIDGVLLPYLPRPVPYSYGDGAAGERQLAADLLLDAVGDSDLAVRLSMAFGRAFLRDLPHAAEHVISQGEILAWLLNEHGGAS